VVIFDVASAFIIGGAVGIRSKGNRPDLALLAGGLGMAVPGLYFLEAYPAWDWQYLIDPSKVPVGVPALFVGSILMMALFGHWICSRSIKVLATAFLALLIYVGFFWHETLYVGTLAEYEAGQAAFLPAAFIQDLCVVGSFGFAAMVWALWMAGRPITS